MTIKTKDLEMKEENKRIKEITKRIENVKSKWELLMLLFLSIKEKRKWWLLPLLIFLAVLSIFMNILSQGSILPAIYTFF